MNPTRDAWAQSVANALEAHAVTVVQMGPLHWAFAPAGAHDLRATVRITDDWLLFDAPLAEPAKAMSVCDVFVANATLPGGVKACGGSGGTLRLRAERPLVAEFPLARCVQEVCAGLAVAASVLRDEAPDPHLVAIPPQCDECDTATSVDLQQLCAQTGWPFTVRGSDTVMIELDVPGDFRQAAVELQQGRGMVISIPVLSEPPHAPMCAAAVGALLLRVTGLLRMVRAAAAKSRGPVYLEVVRASVPPAEELAHACAALSMAWRWAGREAAVLASDERMAEQYVRNAAVDLGSSTLDFSTMNCGQSPH